MADESAATLHHNGEQVRMRAERAIENAIETAEHFARRAVEVAKTTAKRLPVAAVVVAGGGVLLAADVFGIGELLIAGAAGYAAYRMLKKHRANTEQSAHEGA